MKNLFALFVSLTITSGNLFASAPTKAPIIARYRFSVVEGLAHSAQTYASELYSDGKLVVLKKVTESMNFPHNFSLVVKKVKLSSSIFQELKQDVLRLADAQIKNETHLIVCMMIPLPGSKTDHLEVNRDYTYQNLNSDNNLDFTSELTLVDGPHACWLGTQTHPQEQYDQESAALLKRSLKILAL